MQIRCPVCDYTRDIDVSKIPPTAEFATCPKCRHRFRFRAIDLETVEKPAPDEIKPQHADVWEAMDSLQDKWRARDEHARRQDKEENGTHARESRERPREHAIPWENPAVLGRWQSFVRTTLWILAQPAGFFATISKIPALLPAFLYYIIFGMTQYVFNVLWTHFLGSMMRERLVEIFGEDRYREVIGDAIQNSLFSTAVLSVPFLLTMQLCVIAMVIHVIMRLMDPSRADFALSFKVASYASAGLLLSVIPALGSLIAPVWYISLLLIGCRNAFRLTWGKALLTVSPLLLLMLFAASSQYSYFLAG